MILYCSDKAAKGANLTGQAAEEFRAQYAKLFSDFYLDGTDGQSEEELIERWSNEYETNITKFEKKMKEVCEFYVNLTDLNSDGKISLEEYKAQVLAQGLDSFDDKYFNAFPKDEDGEIPNGILLQALEEYYCNSDDNNVSYLEKIICYGFKVIDNI